MSNPEVMQRGRVFHFAWSEGCEISVSKVKEHSDGRITAQMTVKTTSPGYQPYLLQTILNLTALQGRNTVGKTLKERCPEIDWDMALEQLCFITLSKLSEGEPVQEICSADEVSPPAYLLYPVLQSGQPTLIYGEGEVGKSYLALMFGICIQLPWIDNPLRLSPNVDVNNVLYLDYETDSSDIKWRLQSIKDGMGIPDISVLYRRCTLPVRDEIEQIEQAVIETRSKCIIIDSLAAACGGDLTSAEPAISLFSAIRQLNVTSLLLTHTSKNSDSKKTSPYGSVYFTNFARGVFEIKKSQEADEDEIAIGLFHRKANSSKLLPPLGFRLSFAGGSARFFRQDLSKDAELSKVLPLKERIAGLLTQGSMTIPEIAGVLETSEGTVKTTLNRYKNQFIHLQEGWGLLSNNTVTP
jgi:hypothetical protein